MTRAEAHAVLDAARDGAPVRTRLITAALRATGDLIPERRRLWWRRLVTCTTNPRSSDAEPSVR